MTTTTNDFGTLCDYNTGDAIRPATKAERDASREAGDTGVFLIDEDGDIVDEGGFAAGKTRSVYVEE